MSTFNYKEIEEVDLEFVVDTEKAKVSKVLLR